MKKQFKVIASFGVATITLIGATQFSSAAIDRGQSFSIKNIIETKQQIISNNPYIPQYKKDIINNKLETKKNIIGSKENNSNIPEYKKDLIISKLEAEIKDIKNNPNIQQYKKDLVISKLEAKIDLINR